MLDIPLEYLLPLLKDRQEEGKKKLILTEKIFYELFKHFTRNGKNTYSFSYKDLSALTGFAPASIKRIVDGLQKKGYIKFRIKPNTRMHRIILWMAEREDYDTYFFDVPLSLHARSLLLLMYKTTEGRKKGFFFTGLYKKVFHNHKPAVMKIVRELERYGFCVGRLQGHAYIFEKLKDLPFSYKDFPSPLELSLQHSRLYGFYTTLFLLANADCTVYYPLTIYEKDKEPLKNIKNQLIKMGYLERIDLYGYKLKVIPEPYRGRFMKEAFL